MDFNTDPEFAKCYRKHKLNVKKWEKDFKNKFGRIPSKYDIKEASSDVRYSYKRYFDLKTSALEESLSQIDDEFNVSNLDSFGSFDSFDTLTSSQDLCDDFVVNGISSLPTSEQLEKLLEDATGSINVTNRELNVSIGSSSKLESVKYTRLGESSNSVWGPHVSKTLAIAKDDDNKVEDINLTLSQRLHSKTVLPRKPRKSLKKIQTNSETSLHAIDRKETENNSNVHHPKIAHVDIKTVSKSYSEPSVSINMLSSCQKPPVANFRVNEDWLIRCQDDSKSNTRHENDSQPLCDVINNSNEIGQQVVNLEPSSCFGLSNVNIPLKNINIANEACFTDYVENSESESEGVMSQVLKKKLRPVMKKRKLEEIITEDENVVNSENNAKELCTESSISVNKKIFKTKRNLKNGSMVNHETNKKNTRFKKKSKCMVKDVDQPLNEDYYFEVSSEPRSIPRYQIKTSVLKDKNLIEGLASMVDLPVDVKKQNKVIKEALTPEEKLQLKIDSGTLNENFVQINIEKKVFVRGRKNMSYSTFKKQQWKKKKASLGPDFPEGGIITCFKCGESGHMSRYCRAHKGENLLSLEAVKETEVLPTLEEAKKLKANELNECSKQYQIPESFLKLLNEPITSQHAVNHSKVSPVCNLNDDGSVVETREEVLEALKEFGHSSFRPGQEKAIMRILSGQSTLVTLSTGSGKSLCYQLPAYLYAKRQNCISVVISPLVSLMEDQVSNMPKFLRAGCLHTNQSPTQRNKIVDLIKDGVLDILLISPEAVVSSNRSSGFGGIFRQLPPIAFACIDEVHCVSQWSHNFRPTYLTICRVLKEKLKVKCILGLTATATKITMKAIIDHIGVSDGLEGVITNLPLPNNLELSISRDNDKDRALIDLLLSDKFKEFKSIIIYCLRRDVCEQVAAKIRASISAVGGKHISQSSNKRKRMPLTAAAYHAGMSAAQRRKIQDHFMSGDLRIVVATIAFGMGINKSDVRGVIHYNMPSTFESYVQEVGRAGRDGLPAHCHVFVKTDNSDKNELLRHIYANSIERHAIRKLLQKIFVPCQCNKANHNIVAIELAIDTGENKSAYNPATNRCAGHEAAIPIDDCVAELDIPSENIMTLLCYLELHPKRYIQVLNNAYITCKVISYCGSQYLQEMAHSCPPLAMGLAILSKQNVDVNKESTIEFNVIEAASAIGWDSSMAKYHLKNLEWEKVNGLPKKAPIKVEFNTLGFRVSAPGDLSSSELDEALDLLFARVQSQELNLVRQLEEISKTLFHASHTRISDVLLNEDELKIKSDKVKDVIRNYFERDVLKLDVEIEERSINEPKAISDIRGLINAYRDCTFTGRAIARILQGVSSPNFPALVWGRSPFWRTHLSEDFNKLAYIATQQIIQMK